ncbi:aminotransferase class IV family protein [Saccharomonospora piscinae]|uniref:aminotransferase class IV family protein n=1 Tax=Saccharomonospora piscinae TaxID=687388 RepID=UPI000465AF78|nr:aminotransferase class IV family protein [Saccharomonospora piscinae]
MTTLAQRGGHPATAEDLAPLAFAGYAHFTAMQVSSDGVRGLDLHLHRLRSASRDLFGSALPDELVRHRLRTALAAGPGGAVSLTATVFSTAGEFTAADGDLDLLVRLGPAATPPAGPLSLDLVEHERMLPGIKHVGEVAKTYYLREATARGHDDAAFVDRRGRIGEATIWNLAFWDGHSVVWPRAAVLPGVTMGIVRRQLDHLGVPQREQDVTSADLPALAGAVVLNSWTPAIPVRGFAEVPLPVAPEFARLLHDAYDAEPFVAP